MQFSVTRHPGWRTALRFQEVDVTKGIASHTGSSRSTAVRRFGVAAAGAMILLCSTAAFASEIKPGQPYQGQIVACGTETEAETLRGFVISGDLDKAKNYLQADGNTCGVGSVRFIPEAQVGETKNDPKGNGWKIVKIALPTSEAFLVTTADFVVGEAT
jgi:hypothetical protein